MGKISQTDKFVFAKKKSEIKVIVVSDNKQQPALAAALALAAVNAKTTLSQKCLVFLPGFSKTS